MSRISQKRQQFKVNIRKQKIDQIFKLRRRQIVLSNIEQEVYQDFYKKIQQFKSEISRADQIMKQAIDSYDFQKCLQGLQITLFILQKYNSINYYKEFKKLSELVIQTQITDNMFKMYQLCIDCKKQKHIAQKMDEYALKITQNLICNQKYSMEMIKNQAIYQHLLYMLINGAFTANTSSKIAFILANSLIDNTQLAFKIRRESHLQQILKRMRKIQYELTDKFVVSSLFFMRVLFQQSEKLDDMPACEQSLQFVVQICLQIIKSAAYLTKNIERPTVEDASWVFRYIYEKCWIKPKFFMKEVNLDELAEWLCIFSNDYQIQEGILKIIERVCYRDTAGDVIRGLVRQGRLIQSIYNTMKHNQLLSLTILTSIASVRAKDDFKRDLWPTVETLMAGIMNKQATLQHVKLVFHWFDSQDFQRVRNEDQKILGCLTYMVEVVNPDSLLLLSQLWYRLLLRGYRGNIPQFLALHDEIQHVRDYNDVIRMQKEKAKQNGSQMNMQQGESFKNIQNLQY